MSPDDAAYIRSKGRWPESAAAQADPDSDADKLARLLQEAIERHPAIEIRHGSQPIAYRAWAVELLARSTPSVAGPITDVERLTARLLEAQRLNREAIFITDENEARLLAEWLLAEGPITDANGDELEHGEPDYPGQFEETK
jgi:hypothetical protein